MKKKKNTCLPLGLILLQNSKILLLFIYLINKGVNKITIISLQLIINIQGGDEPPGNTMHDHQRIKEHYETHIDIKGDLKYSELYSLSRILFNYCV